MDHVANGVLDTQPEHEHSQPDVQGTGSAHYFVSDASTRTLLPCVDPVTVITCVTAPGTACREALSRTRPACVAIPLRSTAIPGGEPSDRAERDPRLLRVSHADRDRMVEILRDAAADGTGHARDW